MICGVAEDKQFLLPTDKERSTKTKFVIACGTILYVANLQNNALVSRILYGYCETCFSNYSSLILTRFL